MKNEKRMVWSKFIIFFGILFVLFSAWNEVRLFNNAYGLEVRRIEANTTPANLEQEIQKLQESFSEVIPGLTAEETQERRPSIQHGASTVEEYLFWNSGIMLVVRAVILCVGIVGTVGGSLLYYRAISGYKERKGFWKGVLLGGIFLLMTSAACEFCLRNAYALRSGKFTDPQKYSFSEAVRRYATPYRIWTSAGCRVVLILIVLTAVLAGMMLIFGKGRVRVWKGILWGAAILLIVACVVEYVLHVRYLDHAIAYNYYLDIYAGQEITWGAFDYLRSRQQIYEANSVLGMMARIDILLSGIGLIILSVIMIYKNKKETDC